MSVWSHHNGLSVMLHTGTGSILRPQRRNYKIFRFDHLKILRIWIDFTTNDFLLATLVMKFNDAIQIFISSQGFDYGEWKFYFV